MGLTPSGIRLGFSLSTPGRYFGEKGSGWGGTPISNPLDIIAAVDPEHTPEGTRLLITETTGEKAAYYVFRPGEGFIETELPPEALEAVAAIRETCQPSRVSALYVGGAGGSARAGVTRYPLKLTRAVHENKAVLTVGGAPVFVLPGRRDYLLCRRGASQGRGLLLDAHAGHYRADRIHHASQRLRGHGGACGGGQAFCERQGNGVQTERIEDQG